MSKRWAYLMLSGSALFWSGNFVMGRAFAFDIAPITFSYWRWLTALLVFLPFGLRAMLRDWPVIRNHLPWLVLMGVLGVSGFNTFVYLGLQHTAATNALLINSFIPILIILLTWMKPGEVLSRIQLLGVLVSSFGMLLLVIRGDVNTLLALAFNQGDLWLLLAAVAWAIYSIALKRRPAELSSFGFLTATMIIGVAILSPFYWLNAFNEPPLVWNNTNILAIAYVALFASIFAFLLWNQGVKLIGASTAGQFIHLMPLFGAVMAVIFLGERLSWFHIVGAAAIGGGIYLSLRNQICA